MIHPIEINPVLNGFTARVGCQVLVFTSIEGMLAALRTYLQNPEETEKEYRNSAINRYLINCPVPATPRIGGTDPAAMPNCDQPVLSHHPQHTRS